MKAPSIFISTIFICTFLTQSIFAQTFEGIMSWKISIEITDPKAKKEMEDAQKKLDDPATKAQLKQLEDMEKSPEMKALLDQNPQLRQQLENLRNGGLQALFPTSMTIKIKNDNSLVKLDGGLATEILYIKADDQSYMLNRSAKTYQKIAKQKKQSGSQQPTAKKHRVTPTGETTRILNYTCKKYIIESTEQGKTQKQYIWATNEIKDINYKHIKSNMQQHNNETEYLNDIDGIPLKMEMIVPQGKMTMEVTKIEKQTLDASEFKIPAGFTEKAAPSSGQH